MCARSMSSKGSIEQTSCRMALRMVAGSNAGAQARVFCALSGSALLERNS